MPAQTPHLGSGALGEAEVLITMLCLPGLGAPGVADDDRLIEAGIEVKCQVRGAAAEIDAEPVGEQEEGQPHKQDRILEDLRSNTQLCTQSLHQRCRCSEPPISSFCSGTGGVCTVVA